MIIDLRKFLQEERPLWQELEAALNALENQTRTNLDLEEVKRLHYLYERASADLGKLRSAVSEKEVRDYLESIVARAYSEIHEVHHSRVRFAPINWFTTTFPQTFRKHIHFFTAAVAITLVGCLFGGFAISFDTDAKTVLLPFSHLHGNPSDRVADEESATDDQLAGGRAIFSSQLMTHNTKVTIFTMALGMTWGIGTILILFYNGVILGAVCIDYLWAGEGMFLLGWLLPHGSVEIPAILLGGQSGLLLASALIGWGNRLGMRSRLRAIRGDLITLIAGAAILLVWAGIVEAFFSQYHEPYINYAVKAAFGAVELIVLFLFLSRAGRKRPEEAAMNHGN